MSIVVEIEERRASLRADLAIRATISEAPEPGAYPGDEEVLIPLYGRVVNLSETGALLETDEPICPGRQATVAFRYGGRRMEVKGLVTRAMRLRRGRFCLALRLTKVGDRERRAIRRLVDERRTEPVLN